VRIDLPRDLPCDGVLHVEEASEFAGVRERRGEPQLIHLEDLCLYGYPAVAHGVAAYDHEGGVEGLGDADGGRARGSEVNGEAEMLESILPVVAGYGQETYGGQALVEGVGKRVADPGEVGLSGAIVEGEDKDNAAAGLRGFRGWC
jgi:hypothetical protein